MYFYASEPEVNQAADFNINCSKQEAGSAILGCYSGGNIYIFDVANVQLAGIEEVTAAHETFHAIWDRLSNAERTTLTELLEQAYTSIGSPELAERMAYYDRTEPGQRANELHSILGTEFPTLSPELESHYAKYLSDRSVVVTLHHNYQSVFDTLKAQSDSLALELQVLKSEIDTLSTTYSSQAAALEQEVVNLKHQELGVDLTSSSSVNSYNSNRQRLIRKINTLEASRQVINDKTADYNTKIEQYNVLVVRSNTLTESIDSAISPTPSL
jgi:chromosome segregation ATPase